MDTSSFAAAIAHAPDASASSGDLSGGAPSLAQAADAALDSLSELARQHASLTAARAARIEADEAAREHLARELHDSVGAELAATHFALANVCTWLPADAPAQCAEALALVARSLDAAGEALRHVLDGLATPQLEAGLVPALADWTRGFGKRTGLATSFVCAADVRLARLPAEAALAVFRVAQEALTNVARHARATHADVRIACGTRHLTLTINDDGVGLPRNPTGVRRAVSRRHQYGLAGMRERCAAFGGTLRAGRRDAGEGVPGTAVRASFAWDALLAAQIPDFAPTLVKGALS
jgi:two-component system, NarL family, sensor histidine kinase UhpB